MKIKCFCAIFLILSPLGIAKFAHGAVPSLVSSAVVTIWISPVSPVMKAGNPAWVMVTITNNSGKLLEMSDVPQLSLLHIDIHDQNQGIPTQTTATCSGDITTSCQTTEIKNHQAVYIKAEQSLSFHINISKIYALAAGNTYTLGISENNFSLIDAPRDADLTNLSSYKSTSLDGVSSNVVSFQITP